jgi:hypothetical protein
MLLHSKEELIKDVNQKKILTKQYILLLKLKIIKLINSLLKHYLLYNSQINTPILNEINNSKLKPNHLLLLNNNHHLILLNFN